MPNLKRREMLLKLAEYGGTRPNRANRDPLVRALAECLRDVTRPNRPAYDETLSNRLRELAPHWFDERFQQHRIERIQVEQVFKNRGP